MKLLFTDIKSNQIIVNIDATHVIDEHFAYWVVDFDSPVYKTYDFMIDCALYGLNEGQVTFDSYDDDDGKPLANWVLLDDCAFAYSNVDGFHVDFYDKDVITHDEQYDSWADVKAACADYIRAGLFESEPFPNTWETSSYNPINQK